MIFSVPLDGVMISFLAQRKLFNFVLLTDPVHFGVTANSNASQLVLVPLLASDGLNVAVLHAADLRDVLLCAILADEGAKPQDGVRRLTFKATNTEFVERILEDLLEVLDDCLGLLRISQRRHVCGHLVLDAFFDFDILRLFRLFN